MNLVEAELTYRRAVWMTLLERGGPFRVKPSLVKELRIHRGQQGIYRDLERAGNHEIGNLAAAVGILHTGSSYADDLTEEGVIYHYPVTARGERDQNEIASLESCAGLGLPLFVVSKGSRSDKARDVHMGWITDLDDRSGQVLILFSTEPLPFKKSDPDDAEAFPFLLTGGRKGGRTISKTRPGQAKFRFDTLKRYGCSCMLCEISSGDLLDAAHICGVEDGGSDDARNGLILCKNHHRAVDLLLLRIDPASMDVVPGEGNDLSSLGVRVSSLKALLRKPHRDALQWAWERKRRSEED